jgi:hypothetical protein
VCVGKAAAARGSEAAEARSGEAPTARASEAAVARSGEAAAMSSCSLGTFRPSARLVFVVSVASGRYSAPSGLASPVAIQKIAFILQVPLQLSDLYS